MEYLTDLVTTVPEGTSPVKVDELRAAEAVRAAELAKAVIWSGSGAHRSLQAHGAALGCSALPTRQSFAKSSPRYPFISG
jgi:muconolactone delta-isomerase